MDQPGHAVAPSQQIAAALRARIVSGELRPGDRVPSTRQLVRDWGVALATAARAIALLRDEGLVQTRQGSGTTVRGTPNRGRPTRSAGSRGLHRQQIVATAIDLAQREGLDALSMRRLAGVLGLAPMSLYNYVAGRDELEMLMMRAVFAASPLPAVRPRGWRTTIEVVHRLQWQLYRAHLWLAEVLSVTRPPLTPEAMRHSEWTLAALAEVGLGRAERVHAAMALAGLVKGLALQALGEFRAEEESRLRNSQWWRASDAEAAAVLATGAYPRLSEIGDLIPATGVDSLDAAFHHLLESYLDGLEVRAARRAGHPG